MFNYIVKKIRSSIFKIRTHNLGKDIQVLGKYSLRGKSEIVIGNGCVIYPNVVFWGDGKIVIGDNTKIGDNVIFCYHTRGGITIGKNCAIAANCYLIDLDHGIEKSDLITKNKNIYEPIRIGNDCWLGTNVTILRGGVLNDGCVCGAMSLIKKEYPINSIIVGIPGRVIKYRT